MKTIEIQIVSLPERENLVAELWVENYQLAEIYKENGLCNIVIFNNPNGVNWEFSTEQLINSINQCVLEI